MTDSLEKGRGKNLHILEDMSADFVFPLQLIKIHSFHPKDLKSLLMTGTAYFLKSARLIFLCKSWILMRDFDA